MHSGEIITKMCNLVAPKPHQQMAQLWMIMSELVRGTSYLEKSWFSLGLALHTEGLHETTSSEPRSSSAVHSGCRVQGIQAEMSFTCRLF